MYLILFMLFLTSFVVAGSFLTAFLFLRYGDGWEFRNKDNHNNK